MVLSFRLASIDGRTLVMAVCSVVRVDRAVLRVLLSSWWTVSSCLLCLVLSRKVVLFIPRDVVMRRRRALLRRLCLTW